jgi:peptide/nickel transport system substrate-binding protein
MYIAAHALHPHFYDPLLEFDEQGRFTPMLAESWKNVDRKTWEFKLRKGVKFHNGEPFNAESVKFTLERITDPKTQSAQAFMWELLDSVEVKDELTAIVRTKAPFGSLLAILAITMMLPPKSAKDPAFFDKPAGTGAFRVTRWVKGDRVEMEVNPEWWKGQPKLNRITFRYIAEASTRVASLLAGETHVVDRVPPDMLKLVEGTPAFTVQAKGSVESQWIGLHCGKKPFADVRVRQALNLAVNKEALIKDLLLGHAATLDAPMAPAVFAYSKQGAYTYDPQKAKALLREAGYGSGLPELELLMPKGIYIKGTEICEAIVGQLGNIGAKVKINELDAARVRELRSAGNYDFFLVSWAPTTRDADFALWRWFHSGPANQLRYKNPQVDNLLEQGQQTIDLEARKKPYAEAQKLIWNEVPFLYLYWPEVIHGADKRLKGWRQTPTALTIVRDAWMA